MTKKLNLAEAAADILSGNVSAKKGGQDSFGLGKQLNPGAVKAGHGIELNASAHDNAGEENPDYTKGVPSATAPGKTGLGKQDGVGASKSTGPQDSMGRKELAVEPGEDDDEYETIRDRKQGKKPTQTMSKNAGATFQQYEETGSDEEVFEEDYSYDVSEDVDALLAGENLSEEFKNKAQTIFEAAVNARVQSIAEQIEDRMNAQFDEAVEQVKEELAVKVDDYLNYMVQEWIDENQIAIERGLRAEIVENFIDGLKNLFVEHYIDIPEEKIDIVEELSEKVVELEEELNDQINRSVEVAKELNEHKKLEAIYAVCEGLTQTQVEKIVALAEGVDFTTEAEFTEKLDIIKESYFPSSIKVADKQEFLDESVHDEESNEGQKISDPEMALYAQTISRTLK